MGKSDVRNYPSKAALMREYHRQGVVEVPEKPLTVWSNAFDFLGVSLARGAAGTRLPAEPSPVEGGRQWPTAEDIAEDRRINGPLRPGETRQLANGFALRSGVQTLRQANLEPQIVACLGVRVRRTTELWTLGVVRASRTRQMDLEEAAEPHPDVSLALVCAVARLYLRSIRERARRRLLRLCRRG